MKIFLGIFFIVFSVSGKLFGQKPQLESNYAQFISSKVGKGQYTVNFAFSGKTYYNYQENHPITLEVDSVMISAYYSNIKEDGDRLVCTASIKTKNRSRFGITDIYKKKETQGNFAFTRKIMILDVNERDKWFNSFFGITYPDKPAMRDLDIFVPGIWYKDNQYLPDYALASNYDLDYYYFREDRLPLPLTMSRDKHSGTTITVIHKNSIPDSFWGETGRNRIIDSRMQFGSMGFRQKDKFAVIFMFPGSEGDRTYIRKQGSETGNWSLRSHPIEKRVKHEYELVFNFSTTKNFPGAVKESWKNAYRLYSPEIYSVNMKEVYQEEIKLLNAYWANINGAPGLPFSVYLPNGNPRAYNYQMGFIGAQLPNAYYLIRNGLEERNPILMQKGILMVDFWAKNSLTPFGLPKTWVESHIDKKHTWREYPTYMRVVGDGMEGALNSWSIMQKNHIDKPEWLSFCEIFGQWLVKNQNEDGSFYIRYDWRSGKPTHQSKYTTTNVIRYLVKLYYATKNKEYLDTAIKAGNFSYDFIHDDYLYVGGVIDNPNVKDRESGQQAIYAFMALYDATKEKKWLNASVQAARYTETFMYSYNIPMALNDTLADFPRHKETTGQTLIATGHSAVDNGFSFSSFQYYRLYLFTGDKHFLDIAKMIMYNSLQTMDLDGKLGYPYRALQTEALKLISPRGHSVQQWLPWNTAAVMDPLHRFMDAFKEFDLEKLEKQPLENQKHLNEEYAKTLGIFKTGLNEQ